MKWLYHHGNDECNEIRIRWGSLDDTPWIISELWSMKPTCAVAVLAIILAVGCWICISCSRTFPSLVNLICPAPPTSILSVPRGPRFVLRTFWSPMAAATLTERAACLEIISAFGDMSWSRDMVLLEWREKGCNYVSVEIWARDKATKVISDMEKVWFQNKKF